MNTYFLYANGSLPVEYEEFAKSILSAPIKQHDSVALRQLVRLFFRTLGEGSTIDNPPDKPDYGRLEALILYDSKAALPDREALIRAQTAFVDLFYYQMNVLGREFFLSSVYDYLSSENETQHAVDFLYGLGRE